MMPFRLLFEPNLRVGRGWQARFINRSGSKTKMGSKLP